MQPPGSKASTDTIKRAMLRITKLSSHSRETTLRVEGRLVAEWGRFLESECARAEADVGALRLDLADVTYVDARGLRALRRLAGRGVALANCMPLVADQLAEEDGR